MCVYFAQGCDYVIFSLVTCQNLFSKHKHLIRSIRLYTNQTSFVDEAFRVEGGFGADDYVSTVLLFVDFFAVTTNICRNSKATFHCIQQSLYGNLKSINPLPLMFFRFSVTIRLGPPEADTFTAL